MTYWGIGRGTDDVILWVSVDQAGLEFTEINLPLPAVLGIKACAIMLPKWWW